MPYKPQAPPLIQVEGGPMDAYARPLTSGKPVTPVTEVTRILDMPLSQFATEGSALEVRVSWLEETLWWVPGLEQVGRLVERGVQRGRILTAAELADLARIAERGPESIVTLVRLKCGFGGEIVSIAVESDPEANSAPLKVDTT